MKTSFFSTIILLSASLFASVANAQTDNQATFESFLKTVYDAYQSGNDDLMWNYYTANAAEISPDGTLTSGIDNLKAGWQQFMGMVDSRPTFTYKLTSWRLITPDVAVVTWDSNADIKIQGQQVGGATSDMAVLHKINGKWKIEFDAMTPKIEMPAKN